MAQATDIENVLADQIWALLEARTTITNAVPVAQRNKGTARGWFRQAIAAMPRESRRLQVSFARFSNSGYSQRDGFDAESTTFTSTNADFDVVRTHEAVIAYTEPMPTDPGANPIKEAIEQTMFLAGPRLGLPDLIDLWSWGTGDTRETPASENQPVPGRVTTLRLTITTSQSATTLITETP